MNGKDLDALHGRLMELGLEARDLEYAHQLADETFHTFKDDDEVPIPRVTKTPSGEVAWYWCVDNEGFDLDYTLEFLVENGAMRITYGLSQLLDLNVGYALMDDGWIPTSNSPMVSEVQRKWWNLQRVADTYLEDR